MKKPNYISITFPVKSKARARPVIRYFSHQEGRVLDIHFAPGGRRNTFRYKVFSAGVETWTPYGKRKGTTQVELILQKEAGNDNQTA